jgi:hypothetical protein
VADPLVHPGGRLNFETNERITSSDLDKIGTMALQTLTGIVAWLCRDLVADQPISGFPGPADCLVGNGGSDLEVTIAKGIGFFYDSAETDAFGMHFKPIVVPTEQTETLGAHHATLPRIDIVCLAPDPADDQASSRFVRDPSTLAVSISSIDKRTMLSYAVQVVAGTAAATPAVPATPSGYIKIAECAVPAASGAVVVTDTRPILHFGQAFAPDPAAEYLESFVVEGLAVTQSSPLAMTVEVAAGVAVIVGAKGTNRVRYLADTLTVTAGDVTDDRIDLVVADEDGTLSIVDGVADPSPVAPAAGVGQIGLALLLVSANEISIANSEIIDQREFEPVGTDQIRDDAVTQDKLAADSVGTAQIIDDAVTTAKIIDDAVTTEKILDGEVTGAKLSRPFVTPALSGITTGASFTLTVTMQDQDAVTVARSQLFLIELSDTDATLADNGQGDLVHAFTTYRRVFRTASTGVAEILISGMNDADQYLFVTPLSEGLNGPEPGSPRYHTWAI